MTKKELQNGLTQSIIEDCKISFDELKDVIYKYTTSMSDIIPSVEIQCALLNIYNENPILVGLIAKAFYENGCEQW